MYSRKSNRNPLPPHLPEHYRGWAFQPQSPPPADRPNEPPKEPPVPPKPIFRPALPLPEPHKNPPHASEKPSPPPFPPLGHLSGENGLSHFAGLNFDELLIIGLILLLGGNGEDNELPLLLALLLFCG